MSSTAQKKDLEDPEVIQDFAALVGSVNRLNHLYLLTVADIRATNNNLWNGWRDSLLKQLYHSTYQWLEHTEVQAKNTQEKSLKKYQLALDKLVEMGWADEKITTLWHEYDLDYFLRHTVDEIVWQSNGRLEKPDQEPLILVRQHNDQHTLELFIFANDRRGLFAAMTACLEQLQLNILDAKINISSDGKALNTFILNGAQQRYEDIITALNKQLAREELTSGYKPQLMPRITKLFKTEPVINFSTNSQLNHTVMELYTHDRPGLLSAVAQVFLTHQIQVINAKMVTLGDQVEDVFFITNSDDHALTEAEKQNLNEDLKDKLVIQAESVVSTSVAF
jgi:[protein-PII] uridylyltransferase